MNYVYLGNNQYRITLTVYRDCFGNGADFDDPAAIGFFDEAGTLIDNIHANLVSISSVPNVINSPCIDPPTNVCYQRAQYIFTTTIPPGSGACTFAYQRCCRNSSIINLANVQRSGATYMAVIPDQLNTPSNSNPVFNSWPPTFVCKNAPFTFDHSATDVDGDSLVYSLSDPLLGGDFGNATPDPPDPPPYNSVSFLNPYSVNNPLGGVPMTINTKTGVLKATPNAEGQFVYGVSVKEYRNGIYLGETRRDFQVNVVSCPGFTVASIQSPIISCGELDVNFINYSFNASTYKWDFGDLNSIDDTSTVKNPSYNYPDTGDFVVKMIAFSPFNSLCNDTAIGLVHVYPAFHSDFIFSNDHCSNAFNYYDRSFGINGNARFWSWNFGDTTVASIADPVHTFYYPGEFNVIFSSAADTGCFDTISMKVNVLPIPEANFTINLDTCTYTIQAKDSSTYASIFQWDFGDQQTDYNSSVNHSYASPGEYDIQLIVATDSFCLDTTNMHISIPPLPVADFDYNVLPCDSNIQFNNHSQNASQFIWSFGDGDVSENSEPFHSYSISGNIQTQLTVISANNCEVKLNKDIYLITRKESEFSTVIDSCEGSISFVDVTNGAADYLWQFGDGTFSKEQYPIHKYAKDGQYNVILALNRSTACSDSSEKTVGYEAPLGEKVFIPNTFTPNGDGNNDFFEISAFRPCEMYSLTIFNRWGQKVFETDDAANIRWDGSFNGEKLPADIYVYILDDGANHKEGTINIMR